MTVPVTKEERLCGACGRLIPVGGSIHCGLDHRLATICPGCQNEIDPDVCYCGEVESAHNGWTGHPFVPMGCDCMREPDGLTDLTGCDI